MAWEASFVLGRRLLSKQPFHLRDEQLDKQLHSAQW